MRHRLLLTAIVLVAASPAGAQEAVPATDAQSVKGVNPADILNRADLIVKIIDLPAGSTWAMAGKFDKKLGSGWGGAVELPFVQSLSAGPVSASGIGDMFVKFRYVKPLTRSLIGLGAVEFVAPTATEVPLGAGKWQFNPGAGIVQMWSPRTFSVVIYKYFWSVAGSDSRPDISVHSARFLQSVILGRGWYVTGDVRHEWQRKGRDESWTQADFEVGRQFSPRFAASAKIGKTWGDRRNDGALELNVRTFF